MMRTALAMTAAFLVALTIPSSMLAQDPVRREAVQFAAGTTGTRIKANVAGRETVLYTLAAEAGQRMQISLSSGNTATYFNVYEPGRGLGDEALAGGNLTGPYMPDINRFDGVLPTSGTYTISVYLYRNAARRGEAAEYTLDISIEGDRAEVVKGDFADGLQGGPDYWRVRAGQGLKLRADPSTGAAVLMTLPDGIEVRNLGCRTAEARRWCRVATLADPGVEGWAAGDFLVEGTGQAATRLPEMGPVRAGEADALVPGTGFNATGQVECYAGPGAEPQMCDFGVIREGNGTGTVSVTLPGGPTRVIVYDGGMPTSFIASQADANAAFKASKVADGYMVSVGSASFVIPDAVIYGG
ncbi:SH3 domain-containing protein [Paracoccus benzoatiresistens]|uniref:SH3 domain-containing protein n=1 Tax=Paracoccus benzoatiresistens TaxID=2997341 RepID=A0ABT4J7P7_9RHOB|nr:SH3 domain-containing protein [Paracoccus sp. EF6]MCZ0963118.1 SH3 domain-containing protein [Paracoccus sp. EF6]